MSLSAINLADIAAGSGGFVILGEPIEALAGRSVAAAGDINGDGFADIFIGTEIARDYAGAAYVVFGKAGGFGTVNLATLGTAGFAIRGIDSEDRAAISIASAGDINGDGFADLLIGAPEADGDGNLAYGSGETYVIYGKASGWGDIDLADIIAGSGGFALFGEEDYDGSGISVASAGDVNGDGFDDFIIGARYADGAGNGRTSSGGSYLVFGKGTPFTTADLTAIAAGTGGFVIHGEKAGDHSGRSVSSAGDINGDGYDDILVGAYLADGANMGEYDFGGAYILFGGAGPFPAAVDLAAVAAGTGGFALRGVAFLDGPGFSVASAGDINGDGLADIIIGASGLDGPANTTTNAGGAYVVFGKLDGFASIDLADVEAGTGGFVIHGRGANDFAGVPVASAGDINGDGLDDLLVSGWRVGAIGEAYVILGREGAWGDIDLDDIAAGTGGFVINGTVAYDGAGFAAASAGDIDGDGFDDILVSAPLGDVPGIYGDAAGHTYVILGRDVDGAVTHLGTSAGETLTGTTGDDVMVGGQGDDTLLGLGGRDAMAGGAGDDLIVLGGLGFRRVDAGSGEDTLAFADSVDIDLTGYFSGVLQGIEGITFQATDSTLTIDAVELRDFSDTSNTLRVSGVAGSRVQLIDLADWSVGALAAGYRTLTNGTATLLLAEGVALLQFGDGADNALTGTAHRDLIIGEDGADTILGLDGRDTLGGLEGDDVLEGGAGNDMLFGGGGNDTLDGGAGNDTADYAFASGPVLVLLGLGAFDGQGGVDTVIGFEAVRGSFFDDQIGGNVGNETLAGMNGADTLSGFDGNDQLDGGADADSLIGGIGNDLYIVNSGGDEVLELAGEGSDRVLSSVSWTMPEHVEWLILTGGDTLDATGSAGANRIDGNAGANSIEGLGGADTLLGGNGSDTLSGGAENDRLLAGQGDDELRGGAGADRMRGDSGDDRFLYGSASEGGDRIEFFETVDDEIVVSAAGFGGGLVEGALDPSRFVANTSGLANAALGQFVWETDALRLWWDADGTGAGARVMLAQMPGATGVAASDIVVIA